MFGFSLAAQLFQGSAERTWNCVAQFSSLLWYKFNHFKYPIMPRSRRRHHSRSRSRSKSHSHDRDRDAKRRKIDNVDSPLHKRSVSEQPASPEAKIQPKSEEIEGNRTGDQSDVKGQNQSEDFVEVAEETKNEDKEVTSEDQSEPKGESEAKPMKQLEEKLMITPKKALSPKHVQKKLESEKKREQKRLEREEKEKKKQEEKEERERKKQEEKEEREKKKLEKKEELERKKQKEEEEKAKKREEKEAKRKEKEEQNEAKRKEREQKKQELEEKSREKQKLEEQKQKAAQSFINFFVPKEGKTEKSEERKTKLFMPFEVKSDMRLAPSKRRELAPDEKQKLDSLNNGHSNYLQEIKNPKNIRRSAKTWPDSDDDVVIIEEDFGESICEDTDKQKTKRMRVKFLKFHENRRPAYYGTWRKKSANISARRPFAQDKIFEYEVDSDDDWEEEEQGESLNGSDDEEKENEIENDDYEVDNEFFVPHGHLSDDEVDDEETSKLSPESHKLKLQLLKDEFDKDMQEKTNKMKARSIGCIWYSKGGENVEEAIDRHLQPLAIITDGQIIINRRKNFVSVTPLRKGYKKLQQELLPEFLRIIQGNINKKQNVVEEFLNLMQNKGQVIEVSKTYLARTLKQYAKWKKCTEKGPNFEKFCWCLKDDVKNKYNFV